MIRAYSYLQRDKASGLLHFRLRVPGHLQPIVGRTEIKRSLRTYDKRVAIPIAYRLYLELTDHFKELENGGPVKKTAGRTTRRSKTRQSNDGFLSKIEIAELITPGGSKAKGLVIDTGDDKKDAEVASQLLGSIQSATPVVSTAPTAADSKGGKLLKIAEKYRAEKLLEGSSSQKTHDEHKATHELLSEVLGNVDVAAIGHREARLFKEVLLKLPSNMNKGRYSGKSVRQLIKMSIPDSAKLHPRTINEKIQRASSLLSWAVRHGYATINPFDGLKLKLQSKASEERAAFDPEDLASIFDPVRFNQLRKPFQRWCTLLALYTGGRAQELAQLRVCDVFEAEEGLWAIRITKEAGDLKTTASEREIPLHPVIIERGFLQYVGKMKAAGHEKLFPCAWDTKNGPGDKLSRWFATYRKNLKIGQLRKGDGRPPKSLHSFRHCFADGLKQAGVDGLIIAQLLGHSDQSISTGRYGKSYPLSVLYEAVCLLDFSLPEADPQP
ncbi:MAG: DUF6538 domain-containing protein [Desulfobulbus sp.]|jgi:integrase